MGQVGGVLVPIGLFWLAFTTYASVPWIVPIIASIPYVTLLSYPFLIPPSFFFFLQETNSPRLRRFGAGMYFVFTSTFTYLVTAYRPIAASAMASNSALRSTFAAAFPLFAGAMYGRLGTVGATALLAGLTAVMAPLP